MFEKMLVAVDGSDHAFKAVELAGEIARHHDSQLYLVHVIPESGLPAGLEEWARVEHVEALPNVTTAPAPPDGLQEWARTEHVREPMTWLYEEAVAEALLESAATRAREKGAKKIEPVVEHGDPARGILRAAERLGVDTIVMGTRGLGDLAGLLLGSVAHKVTSKAHCTVITVR